MEIFSRTIDEAFYIGMQFMKSDRPMRTESRNGAVLVAPFPVLTIHSRPRNNMLFHPARNANPFFHVIESLWMLNGQEDVATVEHFVKRMREFSDDGLILAGAYGFRWRKFFGVDQLRTAIDILRNQKGTRRVVIQMWAYSDLTKVQNNPSCKDVPCNTSCYFYEQDGRLNLTVTCRSNDMIWGAYGANAVHFAFLLEYMAAMTGLDIGQFYQFSNNFHAYESELVKYPDRIDSTYAERYFTDNLDVGRIPLVTPLWKDGSVDELDLDLMVESFDAELRQFMAHPFDINKLYIHGFFPHVAMRLAQSWNSWKSKDKRNALYWANAIASPDIRTACTEWLERRKW